MQTTGSRTVRTSSARTTAGTNRRSIDDLTRARFDLLCAVFGSGQEEVPQKQIHGVLGVGAPTVSRGLGRLEELGFVRRHRGAQDKRTKVVRLTPRGRRRVQREIAAGMQRLAGGARRGPRPLSHARMLWILRLFYIVLGRLTWFLRDLRPTSRRVSERPPSRPRAGDADDEEPRPRGTR